MPDEERIEQLELEVKVLRANNKGLKDKIDEQSKEIEELKNKNNELIERVNLLQKECNEENRRCMLLAVENQDLKDKNKKMIL